MFIYFTRGKLRKQFICLWASSFVGICFRFNIKLYLPPCILFVSCIILLFMSNLHACTFVSSGVGVDYMKQKMNFFSYPYPGLEKCPVGDRPATHHLWDLVSSPNCGCTGFYLYLPVRGYGHENTFFLLKTCSISYAKKYVRYFSFTQ